MNLFADLDTFVEKIMRLNMTDLNKQFQVYQLMTILKTKHLNIMNMKLNIDYILQPENEDD